MCQHELDDNYVLLDKSREISEWGDYKGEYMELKNRVVQLEDENTSLREALELERSKTKDLTSIAQDANLLRE